MSIRHRPASVCLLILLTFLTLTPAAQASPRDRKTLVLRGRVTDAEGWPVVGARVSALGTRRARVTVDDAGQFALDFPFGSLDDLARNPVSIRVRAEQKGWTLAMPSGEPDLGFELRVVPGDKGVARCEVRANEPHVAAALVRALSVEGDATGVAIMSFIGARGGAIATPATLDLPVVELIPLSGVDALPAPVPPVESSEPVTVGKKHKKGDGDQTLETPEAKPSKKKSKKQPELKAELTIESKKETKKESKKESKSKSKPAPEPVDPPVTIAPETPPAAAPRPSSAAERELAETKLRAERERSVAREETRRLREEAQKRDRLQRRGSDEEKPRILDDGTDHRVAEDALKQTRDVQDRRWEALRHEVHMIAGSGDTTSAPPVTALDGMAGAPARPEHRDKEVAAPPLTARRDTVAVHPPQPGPEPPPPSPWARMPATSAGGDAAAGSSRVFPRPDGESRARALPLVIRAPGLRPAKPDTATATGDSCTCRIKGTVEVVSEQPLPSRTRVAISLVWYPAVADTVELFMGSPRSFTLPVAPCGPQRLRLVNLGGMRFDVTSREAMAGFRCEGGRPRQFRVILQPR
jgi:hypothetical protein